MTKSIPTSHLCGTLELLELDLRRAPVPFRSIPAKYKKQGRLYLIGFEAGWRGWSLEAYFQLNRSDRREAIDAGFYTGLATLSQRLERGAIATGVNPGAAGDDIAELRLRSARLPGFAWPKKYLDSNGTINESVLAAFSSGCEAGYRGWCRDTTYRRADCRNAWEIGYDDGKRALTKMLLIRRRSEEFAVSFEYGYLKRPPATLMRRVPAAAWSAGYDDGKGLAR
jgi:hypothetical protein